MYIEISKENTLSLTKQIYLGLSNKILTNELKEHEKLPSTRSLARELGVSRIIIVEVYEQLISEGYIYSKKGAGSYVCGGVHYRTDNTEEALNVSEKELLYYLPQNFISFRPGVPDLKSIPLTRWGKLYADVVRTADEEQLDYHNPFGSYELRKTLTKYLKRIRGVKTKPRNIMITNGAAQAFSLLRFLLNDNQYVLIENPSSLGLYKTFKTNGMRYETIHVDDNGIVTETLPKKSPKLIFTTPSHQFPTGVILPIKRRIELINYAKKHDAFLVEDDYDSEFRFEGYPIQSLQSIEPAKTIYVGTFSKTFSPAIRMGYMVIPDELIEIMKEAKYGSDIHSPIFEQLTMSKFIEEGYLEKYIRKMNKVYASRRNLICKLIDDKFGDSVEIKGDASGLHMVLTFKEVEYSDKISNYLLEYKLDIWMVNKYMIHDWGNEKVTCCGENLSFVLGYGNVQKEEIIEGLSRLDNMIKSL